MKMKKYLISLLCLIVCVSMCIIPAFASENYIANSQNNYQSEHNKDMNAAIINKAKAWIQDNYKDIYFLRNITAEIIRTFDAGNEVRYTVAMSCEHKYKYTNVYEIPFVKGVQNEIKNRKLENYERKAVNDFIAEIDEDANFGNYSKLNVDIVIVVDKTESTKPWKMYYSDGVGTAIYDIEFLRPNQNELYRQGENVAQTLIEKANSSFTRGYSNYNRVAARDYSRLYTSSPTSCSAHPSGCLENMLQDHSKWNNTDYPYVASIFAHNDCANFVSQAMFAGNLPKERKSSGWYRDKGTSNYSASWVTVSDLKSYMTNASSSHHYWDSSNFADCNRGNIVLTSPGHVVMIDSFDGNTHKFNGHTNDRYRYPFTIANNFTYYVINRN